MFSKEPSNTQETSPDLTVYWKDLTPEQQEHLAEQEAELDTELPPTVPLDEED